MRRTWLVVVALELFGCHARTAADERRDYCEDAWSEVELFPPGTKPTRPFAIVSAVDAMILPTPERRARKMQFKACLLHADAVLDQTEPTTTYRERRVEGPWGAWTTERVETQNPNMTPGKGYAIRWTDVPRAENARPRTDVPPGTPQPVSPPPTAYAR